MSLDAMKQALEALEEIHPGNMTPMAEEAWNKAIATLRHAIEQAERQEPVAWMWKDGTLTIDPDRADGTWTPLYTDPPQREPHELLCVCGASWSIDSEGNEELLSTPPQRQPLTDGELRRCFLATNTTEPLAEGWPGLERFARAIERKHGIGGEA